jgi:hypothetical protein
MADIYIDFSATNDGDGTSPTQAASPGGVGAYNTPVGKDFGTGNQVWFRRNTSSEIAAWTIGGSYTCDFISWPKSGGYFYDSRPSAARALWDGDADDRIVIKFDDNKASGLKITVDGNKFYNIEFYADSSSDGRNHELIDISTNGTDTEFYNCEVNQDYTPSTDGATPVVDINAARVKMVDFILRMTAQWGDEYTGFDLDGDEFYGENLLFVMGNWYSYADPVFVSGDHVTIDGIRVEIAGDSMYPERVLSISGCSSSSIRGIEIEVTGTYEDELPSLTLSGTCKNSYFEIVKIYSPYQDSWDPISCTLNDYRTKIVFRELSNEENSFINLGSESYYGDGLIFTISK